MGGHLRGFKTAAAVDAHIDDHGTSFHIAHHRITDDNRRNLR